MMEPQGGFERELDRIGAQDAARELHRERQARRQARRQPAVWQYKGVSGKRTGRK